MRAPSTPPQLLLLALLPALLYSGCAEPFAVNRHDLGPFRIAAVGVVDGQASAAIWSGQPFHAERPTLAWTLDGAPLGEGFGVEVPGPGRLGLRVTAPDGTERAAEVTVGEAPAPFQVDVQAVDLGQAWELDARAARAATDLDGAVVPAGWSARLSAAVESALTLRWRVALGGGTLLELDAQRADLLPEALEFDDGELVDRRPLDPHLATLLVLALDGSGGNRWQWLTQPMGLDGDWVRHDQQWLDLPGAPISTGLLALTLADIDAETGSLVIEDAVEVSDLTEQPALDCAPAGQPFRLAWLREGRCAVSDLIGQRVVLELR